MRATQRRFTLVGDRRRNQILGRRFDSNNARHSGKDPSDQKSAHFVRTASHPRNVTILRGMHAADTQPLLPPSNVRPGQRSSKTTFDVRVGPSSERNVIAQVSSIPNVPPPSPNASGPTAPGVLNSIDVSPAIKAELTTASPMPRQQEPPLPKNRKSSAHKPSLRAPTPHRGRARFSRGGSGHAAAGGKNGSARPGLGADPIDRLAVDDEAAFESAGIGSRRSRPSAKVRTIRSTIRCGCI